MANGRSSDSLPIYTTMVGWLVVAFCAFGVVADLMAAFGYGPGDKWAIAVFVAAAALVVGGMLTFGKTAYWLSFGLATLGALATAVFLSFTVAVPVVALVFIVLFAVSAIRRRPVAGPVAPVI